MCLKKTIAGGFDLAQDNNVKLKYKRRTEV